MILNPFLDQDNLFLVFAFSQEINLGHKANHSDREWGWSSNLGIVSEMISEF